jgi:hypothetical protein
MFKPICKNILKEIKYKNNENWIDQEQTHMVKIFKNAWYCDTIGLFDVDRDTKDGIMICKHIHTKITVKL